MTLPKPKTVRAQRQHEGDVFCVPLEGLGFGFGQICFGGDHAYFDVLSETLVPPEDVVKRRVIFRVPVASEAISRDGWRILGNVPLQDPLTQPGVYRHQPVGTTQLYRYSSGKSVPASAAEVDQLETLAVWFAMHIEKRLRSHFAGVPDPQVRAARRAR